MALSRRQLFGWLLAAPAARPALDFLVTVPPATAPVVIPPPAPGTILFRDATSWRVLGNVGDPDLTGLARVIDLHFEANATGPKAIVTVEDDSALRLVTRYEPIVSG